MTTIITTHLNADFDGLAAMMAAQKLYPEGVIVFPGSQEKNLRDFLNQQSNPPIVYQRLKEITLAAVTRLVVVDTRNPKRIGCFQTCLDNPGLSLHLFDHHPDTIHDLKGEVAHIQPVGATTTILTQLLQAQEIPLTPAEATVMALGIYEDTGSFLHATTTQADLAAAGYLLGKGADLEVITQFVSRELAAHELALLGTLIKQANQYTIQGTQVVLTHLTLPEYVDNFAVLIKRLMVVENLDVIFGTLCLGERIYMIARSRIPEVNVGHLLRAFGGGGHASAASATVRAMTLFEAEEKLLTLLHQEIQPRAMAAELMSSPAIQVTPEVSIEAAKHRLTRYNITAMPVVPAVTTTSGLLSHQSPVLGMISRQVIEKAIFHQLGHLPVADYMSTDIEILSPEATLADLQAVIVHDQQRLIPVVSQGQLKGVITRTDLLSILVKDPVSLPQSLLNETTFPSLGRTRNLTLLMADHLKRPVIELLREIGESAEKLGYQAFVVGGFVRDLLLKTKNLDIDIVVEGDGIAFAKVFAKQHQGVVRTHEKFRTASVRLQKGYCIDVATARLEYYEHPAAMPIVELSSIKRDLFRRDFTINALAIHLNPKRFGTLVDFFSSQADLKEKRVRVLHNLSFVEDPSRLFRAIRFEQRLDFKITKHSAKLMQNAIRMNLADDFPGARLFHELQLIFSEENPLPALRRIAEFDLIRFLWPDLRPNPHLNRRLFQIVTQIGKAISWFKLLYLGETCETWQVYVLGVISQLPARQRVPFCQRFEMASKLQQRLLSQQQMADKVLIQMKKQSRGLTAGEIYHQLQPLENEGLLYLMAATRKKRIQKAVSLYVTQLQQARPYLNGNELRQLGYAPGPAFKVMLSALLTAQLNGEVNAAAEAKIFLLTRYPLPKTA